MSWVSSVFVFELQQQCFLDSCLLHRGVEDHQVKGVHPLLADHALYFSGVDVHLVQEPNQTKHQIEMQ